MNEIASIYAKIHTSRGERNVCQVVLPTLHNFQHLHAVMDGLLRTVVWQQNVEVDNQGFIKGQFLLV